MHADAAMGAGVVFDPSGMESVVGFEFAPVGHWRALKQPAGRLFAQHGLFDAAAVVCVAVGICAFLFSFIEDAKAATWRGAAGGAD